MIANSGKTRFSRTRYAAARSSSSRLALINNRTVENGEEAEFKFGNRTVKVRCVEIREKSVVIRVDGQSKELFLRQNL